MILIFVTWLLVIIIGGPIAFMLFSEEMDKAGFTVAALGVVLMLSSCVGGFTGIPLPTGEGEHTGYVTAVENAGIIWKAKRAYVKTDTQSSQEDAYCVLNNDVFAQLRKFAETKAHVRVYHESQLVFSLTRCNYERAAIVRVVPVEAELTGARTESELPTFLDRRKMG